MRILFNKYPAPCHGCHTYLAPGEGVIERLQTELFEDPNPQPQRGRWVAWCKNCLPEHLREASA